MDGDPGLTATSVRPATADDAPGIARVHVDSWRAAYAGIVPRSVLDGLSVERREAFWRSDLSQPDHRLWVATSHTIVGFAATGPARDDDLPAGAGELFAIYVLPDSWGRGYGAALFRAATTDLTARGLHPLVLWVLTENTRGRRFYELMGWSPDGSTRELDFAGTPIQEVRYRPAP
jgi:ribosomal protein S18 acetylase RimI-like enzyme